ncbi:hypothetical protein A2Y85_00105 [candidate division WOR-3 bacterium RBG_13_43_14]|uniref:FAD-binding FR-type domain-containing protein n=1 Tax=candidate division WOR-3 bacterium RBG_13_43_14 TaxID=1802590 RepID=A0A1F4UEV5_UNCW3|nr:MAG: hypothetical protein A2Y85_00105 [candidate division WOR-3 bacterium RBG_13_43_14]
MKPKLIRAYITAKKQLNPDTFSLELKTSGLRLQPGHFFEIRTSDTYDPYLNRPISVAGYQRSRLLLIIRKAGRGTTLLHEKNTGDRILMLGPMGKGIIPKKKRTLVIAGGIGIAPLYFLAHNLTVGKIPFSLIYGVRNHGDHILISELKRICSDLILVCERGAKKKVTALDVLKNMDLAKYDIIYACGPKAMFVELQRMKFDQPIYVFCEDFLGCGCGICIGCAIKIKGTYKRICIDGPVFNLKEIDFNV